MFQFLYVFGPAAVTYLIAQRCSGKAAPNWYTALIELICYGALDALLTTILLYPVGRVELVMTPAGVRNIQYGIIAYILSMAIGAICGVAAALLKKYVDIHIEAEPGEKRRKD